MATITRVVCRTYLQPRTTMAFRSLCTRHYNSDIGTEILRQPEERNGRVYTEIGQKENVITIHSGKRSNALLVVRLVAVGK